MGGGMKMDFGDILENWELAEKKKKHDNAEQGKGHKNPMEAWIDRYGVIDKDSLAERDSNRKKFISQKNIIALPVDEKIDLHGLDAVKAEKKLSQFISECERNGYKKILIIHGKGIHSPSGKVVLESMVRRFIEQDKRLGMSGHPEVAEGGNGATWVILKNNLLK